MDTNYSLSDIASATGGNRSNDGFGDGNGWWLILFLLICGWGGYGFGGGFGGYGGGGFNSPAGQGFATRTDIDAALATQGIESGIQNISTQLCNGFNTLGSQMANCCCDLKQGQGEINYNMAAQTNILQNTVNNGFRDVIENQTAGVQRIIDTITQDKIQSLQTELQSAQLQLSNAAQTERIVNTLRPPVVPSYSVMSPYTSIINPTGFTFGVNGCGCNTGCC
mgnify:FL=1